MSFLFFSSFFACAVYMNEHRNIVKPVGKTKCTHYRSDITCIHCFDFIWMSIWFWSNEAHSSELLKPHTFFCCWFKLYYTAWMMHTFDTEFCWLCFYFFFLSHSPLPLDYLYVNRSCVRIHSKRFLNDISIKLLFPRYIRAPCNTYKWTAFQYWSTS